MPGSPGCQYEQIYPEGHVSLGSWHRLQVHLTVAVTGGGSGPNIKGWSLPWFVAPNFPASAVEAFTSTIEENHENGRYEPMSEDASSSCFLTPVDPTWQQPNPPGWIGSGFGVPGPSRAMTDDTGSSFDHTGFDAVCADNRGPFTMYVKIQFQSRPVLAFGWPTGPSPVLTCEIASSQEPIPTYYVAHVAVPSDPCEGSYGYAYNDSAELSWHRAHLQVYTSLDDPNEPDFPRIDGLTLPWLQWRI